jgi:hypothetical protein
MIMRLGVLKCGTWLKMALSPQDTTNSFMMDKSNWNVGYIRMEILYTQHGLAAPAHNQALNHPLNLPKALNLP